MKLFAWISTLLLTLSGCDYFALQEIRPGVTTAAEVRTRMGLPSGEFSNPDGSIVYEYSRQPNGTECHMITIGPDQIVRQVDQVLTEANMAKIQPGMERDAVRRLLGKPGSVQTFEMKQEEVWDWRVKGDQPMDEWHFHVHFNSSTGLVAGTSKRLVMRG